MTNTTKTTTNYKEQATTIYNFNKEYNLELLESTLLGLADNNNKPIYNLDEWLSNFRDNFELVEIVQASDHFDIANTFIQDGIYRRDYKTSDDILELVDKDEAIKWIASALEYDPDLVEEISDMYTDDQNRILIYEPVNNRIVLV